MESLGGGRLAWGGGRLPQSVQVAGDESIG